MNNGPLDNEAESDVQLQNTRRDQGTGGGTGQGQKGAPIFNAPRVILAFLAVLVGIHLFRVFLLSPDADYWVLLTFALLPSLLATEGAGLFGGNIPGIFSFVTHAFLHSDWVHLGFNALWMLAFGTPVARRLPLTSFFTLSLIGAIVGAGTFLFLHWGEEVLMIGASGIVSAYFGAATRFAFEPPKILVLDGQPVRVPVPASTFQQFLKNRRAVTFAGVWMVINLLFGLLPGILGGETAIAWEAHLGGFMAGFLLMPLLDPIRRINKGN